MHTTNGALIGSDDDLQDLSVLVARGAVTPPTAPYALDDFLSAIDDLDAGEVRGRTIFVPCVGTVPTPRSHP